MERNHNDKSLKEKLDNWLDTPMSDRGMMIYTRLSQSRIIRYAPNAVIAAAGFNILDYKHSLFNYVGGFMLALATYSAIDKAVNLHKNISD